MTWIIINMTIPSTPIHNSFHIEHVVILKKKKKILKQIKNIRDRNKIPGTNSEINMRAIGSPIQTLSVLSLKLP